MPSKSNLSWIELSGGIMLSEEQLNDRTQILTRSGRALCSRRDPRLEARQWVSRYEPLLSRARHFIILGYGAGYHIEELRHQYPNLSFSIVECDPRIVERSRDVSIDLFETEQDAVRILNQVLTTSSYLPFVLPFRPCWQGLDDRFRSAFLALTLRKLKVLRSFDARFLPCAKRKDPIGARELKSMSTEVEDSQLHHMTSIVGELIV